MICLPSLMGNTERPSTGAFRFHPAHRVTHQIGRAVDAELLFDVRPVNLNGLDAQVQLPGNFTRSPALPDKLEYSEFAVSQPADRGRAALATTGKYFQDAGGHFVADINLSGEHLPDGLHQNLATFLFHHVAAAAGPQHTL